MSTSISQQVCKGSNITSQTPRHLKISPSIILNIVEKLLEEQYFVDRGSGRLIIFSRERWGDLLNLALVGVQWNRCSRIFVVRTLLTENLHASDPKLRLLAPLFIGPVESTFVGCTTFFELDLRRAPDVQPIVDGCFWRTPALGGANSRLEDPPSRYRRKSNTFLETMSTTVRGCTTLGKVLFSAVVELHIHAPQYPYTLFAQELQITVTSFPNITTLVIHHAWCCRSFLEAVNFVSAFRKLRHLSLGDLLLLEDDEESAWASLAVARDRVTLPCIVSAAVFAEISPYSAILLTALGPYPRLHTLLFQVMGDVIIRLWSQHRSRVLQLFQQLYDVTLSVIEHEYPELVLDRLDLTFCENLRHFTLHTRKFVSLAKAFEQCIPSRCLVYLVIHGLHSSGQLRELDRALTSYKGLEEIIFKVIAPRAGATPSKLAVLESNYLQNMSECTSRGVFVSVSISKDHSRHLS